MEKLSQLEAWMDPIARSAAENMAVDELLLRGVGKVPLVRFYQWSEPSVSFGYFGSYQSAREMFADTDIAIVRRYTGGGVVDHRIDVNYSLVVPREHPWAQLRGAESYRLIHLAVVKMLGELGVLSRLLESDAKTDSIACFDKPVSYDVLSPSGRKLAGAGQRRARWGLLHQGSIQQVESSSNWGQVLTKHLADEVSFHQHPGFEHSSLSEVRKKYRSTTWLLKR